MELQGKNESYIPGGCMLPMRQISHDSYRAGTRCMFLQEIRPS